MTNLKLVIILVGILTSITPIAYSIVNLETEKEKTVLVDNIEWQVIDSENLPNGIYSVEKVLANQGALVEKFNFGDEQHFLAKGMEYLVVGQKFQQLTIDESQMINVANSSL
jgi:hypothetical protein